MSIIDLEGGHQPVQNEDGTLHCVYNGEIYNFVQFRNELIERGHTFSTRSDTEVIVHAYEEFGLKAVDKLWGMFAFALWDSNKKSLLIARDRIGMKPLYWVSTRDGIAFASEVKSLLSLPELPREVNLNALKMLLAFRYTPTGDTVFRRIRKLQPGTQLVWQNGETSVHLYWQLPVYDEYENDERQVVATTLKLVRESVGAHLLSDVPLGVMLSGGIDSSTVAFFAKEKFGQDLSTFTFEYSGAPFEDDTRYASIVAETLATKHREIVVDSRKLLTVLPDAIYHFDEPKVDPAAVPTMVAAREMRRFVKVVLVGEGSDEQFGGYASHLYFAHARIYARTIPAFLSSDCFLSAVGKVPRTGKIVRVLDCIGSLRSQERALLIMNSELFTRQEYRDATDKSFWKGTEGQEPEEVYKPLLREVKFKDELAPSYVDLKVYIPNDIAPKIDRMTMAASLEARVPFLHVPILEYSSRIEPSLKTRAGVTKYPLRQAMKGLLPRSITARRKRPITVPLAEWVEDGMDAFGEVATSTSARRRGIFSQTFVKRLMDKVRRGNDQYAAAHLLGIATVELWYRIFIDPDTWFPPTPRDLNRIW